MRHKALKSCWPWLWPSMSLKVKCEGAVDLPYDFLLMFNSNIVPNKAPLPYISIQNSMSDLEFDISRSLEVKSNDRVGLPINHFLLVSNSNHMSNSHPLGVIAIQFFPVSLSLGSNFAPPPPNHNHTRPSFQHRMVFSWRQREGLRKKWSWSVQYFL